MHFLATVIQRRLFSNIGYYRNVFIFHLGSYVKIVLLRELINHDPGGNINVHSCRRFTPGEQSCFTNYPKNPVSYASGRIFMVVVFYISAHILFCYEEFSCTGFASTW